jgi:hypothetical protein
MEEREVFEHPNFISSRCARIGRLKNGTEIAPIAAHSSNWIQSFFQRKKAINTF